MSESAYRNFRPDELEYQYNPAGFRAGVSGAGKG